jgi:hypothetical protein
VRRDGDVKTPGNDPATLALSTPPVELIQDVKAVFGPSPRREVAHLEFDSLLDGDGIPEDHCLRFEHRRLILELQVSAIGPTAKVSGTVHPRLYDRVYLHRDGTDVQMSDAIVDGHFSFDSLGRGLVRLSVVPKDDRPVIWSEWFRL